MRSGFCRREAKHSPIYRFRVGVALQTARLSHWLEMFHKSLALGLPLVMGETPAWTPRGLIRGIIAQTESTACTLIAINLFALSTMEFPYGNDGLSLLLSMCMLQLYLKPLHHVQNLMRPEFYSCQFLFIFGFESQV